MKNHATVPRGHRPLLLKRVVLATAALLCAASEVSAALYSWTQPSGSPIRKLVLNVPPSLESGTIRGILIHGNGSGADETGAATDPELVAFAESIGFAVLATGRWYNFETNTNEFSTFVSKIGYLAGLAGHPELVDAPWIAEGFSNGGQMAYGLNALAPEKVIAFVANKGRRYNVLLPSAAALKTPGLLIAGENDEPINRNALEDIFLDNRALGARWAWVEEENTTHAVGDSYRLIRPFLAECVRLRYPAELSPENGPPTLLELPETSGWLVDHNTWTSGVTQVYEHGAQAGSHLNYGWVPNERIALLYRAFSTYNKSAGAVSGGSIVVNETLPTTLNFSVNMTGQTWSSIEFFEGATSLGTVASGNPASITHSATVGGYHVFHGLITKPGGAKSSTKLHPVFVVGPLPDPEDPEEPPVPALKVLVDFGPAATTTVGSGDDPAHTWNNFTSHSLNSNLGLLDATGAGTGITLTVTIPFAGNQSTGTTSPVNYVPDAVRDSFYFDGVQTPQLRLTGLDSTKAYDFKFLGSRMTGDSLVRSTLFTVQGFGSAVSTVNNATNNTGTVSTVNDVLPTAAGEITITLDDDVTNNTNSNVGYLGVLEISVDAVP